MRVEQKVHERGFLCVSLWVCNKKSRLKSFLKWRKFFFLAQIFAKVHVDMSNSICIVNSVCFILQKLLGDFSRKFGESLARAWRKMAFP